MADSAPLTSDVFWRASLITAGGFTGGGAGLEVWSDGTVFTVKRDTAGSDSNHEYQGTIPASSVQEIWTLLEKAKAMQHRQRGNMTTTLTWQDEVSSFRYVWSWSGFGTHGVPEELAQLESLLADPSGMEAGTPPFLKWGEFTTRSGAAELLLAKDRRCVLALKSGDTEFQAKGSGVGGVSALVGAALTLDPSGDIRINKVEGGWISGEISKDGKTGSFRLPVWVTSKP